jgi:hypothetical protein
MDILYVGIAAILFVLSWGLALLCDRLSDHVTEKNP